MRIYWTQNSIPEFSNLPRSERSARWRRANKLTIRHWQTWVALAAIMLVCNVGSIIGGMFEHPTIGTVTGAVLGGFIYLSVVIFVARKYHKNVLLGQDCPDQIINVYRPGKDV